MNVFIVLIIILILLICLLLIALAGFILLIPFFMKPNHRRDVSQFKGKLFAHRGLHDNVIPENSIPAFKAAVENGYGVELDVQMTADGRLVVFHDGNLERMCGVNALLKDYTYEELSKFRLKETNEIIPLFSDVLSVLGKTDLICEIKGDNGQKNYTLCEKVYDMLKGYEGAFCIESFSPFLVGWFKNYHPEIIRGQLSQKFTRKDRINFPVRLSMNNLWVNVVSRPDFIAFRHEDKGSFGFRVVRFLYRPFIIAWTAKGQEEQFESWKVYDSVIFEKGEQQ